MPRFKIKGKPHGRTFQVGDRFIATNSVDGGMALSEAQQAFLKQSGYELVKVDDVAPVADPEEQENVELARVRQRSARAGAMRPDVAAAQQTGDE